MGTSLHGDWKGLSVRRQIRSSSLGKEPGYLLRRRLKQRCKVKASYLVVNRRSGRACSTCGASNWKSTQPTRPLGPWSHSQTPDTGSSKVPWEVPAGMERREVTESSYHFSENMLNQRLRAIKAAS